MASNQIVNGSLRSQQKSMPNSNCSWENKGETNNFDCNTKSKYKQIFSQMK